MTDSKDETIQSKNENSDVENIQENDVDTGTSSSSDEEKNSVSVSKISAKSAHSNFHPHTSNFVEEHRYASTG